jgi:hypothetical protein
LLFPPTHSQFAKLKTKEGQKMDFRNNLKQVEKKQFTLDDLDEVSECRGWQTPQ